MSDTSTKENPKENTIEVTLPESFEKLAVGLPPMLLPMAGYNLNARFVAFNYFGSKATWHDGRGLATFSYFSVYSPFVDHPAIAVVLRGANADLGSDDSEPTHALVFDRQENSIYLGRGSEVSRFLNSQHPPIEKIEMTDEMLEEIETRLVSEMSDMSKWQFRGMFELFAPAQDRRAETDSLIEWLNENTPSEVREYFAGFGVKF